MTTEVQGTASASASFAVRVSARVCPRAASGHPATDRGHREPD